MKVAEKPVDQTVSEGESACFSCRIATTTPHPATPPCVTWYFNDDVIAESDIYRLSQHDDVFVLTLPECFPEDAGTYTVKADDGVDVDSASAELVVRGSFVRRVCACSSKQ